MAGTLQKSSTPPRPVKREEDEDQHGADNVSKSKAYRGLSNELIRKIYDELFAAKHVNIRSKGPQPRLNDILLSKRIYAVARPAWLYGLKIVSSARLVDRAVAGLMQDDAACAAVRAFEIKVFANQEFTTAAMLGRLPNLWLLRLSFNQEQGHDIYNTLPCPNSIVKVLAKFPRLRHLEFLDPVTFQTDFPVCPSQLRHVAAAIQSFSPRFSAFLQQSAVQTLLISVGFSMDQAFGRGVALGDLPWASLRQLTLRFDPEASSFSAQSLLDSLDAQVLAYPGPLPLRKLVIDLLGKGVDFAAIVDSTLSTFAPRGATSFRFHTVETAGFSPVGSFGGDVQELSIFSQTPYNLTKGRNFANLAGFLERVPTLRRFYLYGLAVDADGGNLDLRGLNEARITTEYPMLFALLWRLTQSSVTTFVIASQSLKTSPRYRWKRPSRDKFFRLE